ncbi:MAG: serine hydrolase domain-containing protein [Flavobacteriaceae bacterium]
MNQLSQEKKKPKKLVFKIILFTSTFISMFFVPWLLVWAWILPLPNTVQEQVDQAITHGFDGMIVYTNQGGKEGFYAGGWHDKEAQIPADPHALFKIASISKLYLAATLTKLVQEDKLDLDAPLSKYLPELQGGIENANEITLRMMVGHRSGIPNFTDSPNFWSEPAKSYEESLALILNKPANFEPGTDYEYCNTNYLLLARIIDQTLGYEHYEFIQSEILDPLELKHTYKSLEQVDLQQVMSGYHQGYPYNLREDEHGMLATAQDVGTFVKALNQGGVFSEGGQEIYESIYELEHGGWVPGYQSFVAYHKDIDAIIVAFYSTTDSELYNWNLSEIINSRIYKILKKNP